MFNLLKETLVIIILKKIIIKSINDDMKKEIEKREVRHKKIEEYH